MVGERLEQLLGNHGRGRCSYCRENGAIDPAHCETGQD